MIHSSININRKMQDTQQANRELSASYETRSGNEVGLYIIQIPGIKRGEVSWHSQLAGAK